MGRPKPLLPWGNKSLIAHLVGELQASLVDSIFVITGKDHKALEQALIGLNVKIIHNPNLQCEMLDSLRMGLRQIDASADAFMVVLGDQPSLQKDLINGLIRFWKLSPKKIARPNFQGRGGHPIIVPIAFAKALFCGFDAVGLRGLLRSSPSQLREWPVADLGVISDIDTPEDFLRERTRLNIHNED